MQTILGSTGIIGSLLAKALTQHTNAIRLVSRNPQAVNPGDELVKADLLDADQTAAAVAGSDIVYLTAGLVYKSSTWEQQWPVVMRNTIAACKQHGAKLVFFDNVYSYGPVKGAMTEQSPLLATTRKGKLRVQIVNMLLDAISKGDIQGMICRAPDFYGPGKTLSAVNMMVFENIKKGKKAQWMITDQARHTYIFTPDAANATALLGNTPDAWNQTWHLPCSDEEMTGAKMNQLCSDITGKPVGSTILSKFMLRLAGLFIPAVRESMELLYQYSDDYIFSSDKFKQRFPSFPVTGYRDGVTAVLKS